MSVGVLRLLRTPLNGKYNCTESDPEERNNIAETELEIVAALVKQLKDLTHEFEVPLAPSEEDNYFMGNPLAGLASRSSRNVFDASSF